MAGTVTTSEERIGASVHKVVFDWLSSAGGAADATSSYAYTGRVVAVHLIPDSGGTTPTDQYDVVLTDVDSRDLLFGKGANCSSADTVIITDCGYIANDTLTLGVTNGGNAKGGIVVAFVEID